MHFTGPTLTLFALTLGIGRAVAQRPQPSSSPVTAVCPTEDSCSSPLCTGGAVYGSQTADFKCFYSEGLTVQECTYPLSVSRDLFCTYSSTGALVTNHDSGCCPSKASTGTRTPTHLARSFPAAVPVAGHSPADLLRHRVREWRARDLERRELASQEMNEVEKRSEGKRQLLAGI